MRGQRLIGGFALGLAVGYTLRDRPRPGSPRRQFTEIQRKIRQAESALCSIRGDLGDVQTALSWDDARDPVSLRPRAYCGVPGCNCDRESGEPMIVPVTA